MKDSEQETFDEARLGLARRKAVSLSQQGLIKANSLLPGKTLPLVIQPVVRSLDLVAWARSNRDFIESSLLKHGGVLFRGFKLKAVEEFEQLVKGTCGELLEYKERSSPRTQVSGNIYTSTDYPANQGIFLHNENSYQNSWPLKIFFYCVTPAQQGGETPIADCRRVGERIAPQIRERFVEKNWMYVRNFGDGLGLGWERVFQTTAHSAVEEHCERNGIEVEWKEGNRLRTRSVRPAVAIHPRTGEEVWFNHATFFHVTTLDKKTREALLAKFPEEDLPTNTYYGDGTSIEPAVLEALQEAYRQETVTFRWEIGDILMLDNMLTAHGRAPYVGARKVLVAMAEPVSRGGK
jgi:alpha-ketoglutarate-dependent taurine dioxygenase